MIFYSSMPLSYDLFVGQKPLETPALVTKGLDTSTRPESSTNGSLINGIGLKLPGNSISTVSTTPNPTITASISNGVAPLSSFFKPKSSSQRFYFLCENTFILDHVEILAYSIPGILCHLRTFLH